MKDIFNKWSASLSADDKTFLIGNDKMVRMVCKELGNLEINIEVPGIFALRELKYYIGQVNLATDAAFDGIKETINRKHFSNRVIERFIDLCKKKQRKYNKRILIKQWFKNPWYI